MKRTLIIIGLLALLIPSALLAQEKLTLEGLADQLTALEERQGALEAMFADPWSPDVIYMDDGMCQYGGSQCLDHETEKIRCIQTDAVGSDQSTKCSSAGVR